MILAIETATAACSVALLADGSVVDAHHEPVGRGHAERLLPMIRALLGGRRPAAIAVDCGPGSFTGVRVGLAAARALGLGWGVPVHGFSSLALLAAGCEGAAEVTAAIAGGHGELFVQSFAGMPRSPTTELRSLPPAAAAREAGASLVVGSGAAALVEARGWGEASPADPDPRCLPRLAPALTALAPVPIYGRAPDARPAAGR